MAKATGWIFHCLMLLEPNTCLLGYRSTYNAFFMDLPVPSFVSHSSVLTAKGVNLVVARDSLPGCVMKIVYSGYFDCRGAFRTVLDL